MGSMDIMLATSIVGFLATTTSFIRFLPQAVQTWKQRKDSHALSGLSLPTQWLTFVNSLLWILYGVLLGELWVAMPSLLNAPMALFVIILVIKNKMKVKQKLNDVQAALYKNNVDFAEGKISQEAYVETQTVLNS